jgi:hypothetical protein
VFGRAVFPLGVELAAIEMPPALARGVPIAAGVVVLIAGSNCLILGRLIRRNLNPTAKMLPVAGTLNIAKVAINARERDAA